MNRSINSMVRALFVICFLLATWHFLRVVTAPLVLIVQYLPDDAFYYLGISRNLGLLGKSSFDGGQTLTTGYHPLWAWASEFLGWLGGYQPMRMLREMIIVSGVLSLGAAAVAGRLAWRNATTTLPVIMVLLTSFSYLNNSVSAMEWCLVIVISAAALWLLLRVPSGREGLMVTGLASLGVLGYSRAAISAGRPPATSPRPFSFGFSAAIGDIFYHPSPWLWEPGSGLA